MFNNPFDSFHNTVAEAKEEREQLDRLLTISTPRERLLVVVIALFLSIFVAWLFFGNVARSLAVDGVLVGPSEILPEGNQYMQALVWVKSDIASHIVEGMPAVIELGMAGGKAGAFDGKVATISTVYLSEGLAAFESLHRVEIALDESLEFASLVGRKCRIVIQLGKQAPIALFRMRQS